MADGTQGMILQELFTLNDRVQLQNEMLYQLLRQTARGFGDQEFNSEHFNERVG